MDIIVADPEGKELGYLTDRREIDADFGKDNTFEIVIDAKECPAEYIPYCRWYAGGEIGGLITDIEKREDGYIALRGPVWRGVLAQKILCPESGTDYLQVSGELNAVIAYLTEGRFDGLVQVSTESTGISVTNYQFPRYCDLLIGIERMLNDNGHRLDIAYQQENKCLIIGAVAITDYSAQLEYGSDGRIRFSSRQYLGITHLICLGSGELSERMVRHLYVQENGTIGTSRAYTGLAEREAVLDYPNADSEDELMEKGIDRLKEKMSYTTMNFEFDGENVDIPIGDIVGGRDRDAGITVKKPIVQKIVRISGLSDSIECKVGD